MSSRRVIILLIAGLLVVSGALWLSSQRHLDRAVAVGQTVLPDLKQELDNVTEVRLAKGDSIHATLKKAGTEWMVAERNFVADAGRVRKLLRDLAALEVMEEKTSDPQRYSAIGVEDTAATRVEVIGSGGRKWALLAGKSSGAKSSYTRVAGAQQSFLSTPRLDLDFEPQSWLDKTIVDIPEARIQTVEAQPAKGPSYTVTREKREQQNFTVSNVPKKRKLSSEDAGNSLARGLESVSLDDVQPLTNAGGASAPGKTIERSKATYRTFDGITVSLAGRKESSPGLKKDDPKVEKFFITLTAASTDKATQPEAQKLQNRVAGREFEISSYKYEGIFKPMEDLLEPLPEKSGKD